MLFLVFYRSMIALKMLFYLVLLPVQQHRKDQLLSKSIFAIFPGKPLTSRSGTVFFSGALNSA